MRNVPAAVWYTTAESDYSGIEVGIGRLSQMTDEEIRDPEEAAAAITDVPES